MTFRVAVSGNICNALDRSVYLIKVEAIRTLFLFIFIFIEVNSLTITIIIITVFFNNNKKKNGKLFVSQHYGCKMKKWTSFGECCFIFVMHQVSLYLAVAHVVRFLLLFFLFCCSTPRKYIPYTGRNDAWSVKYANISAPGKWTAPAP